MKSLITRGIVGSALALFGAVASLAFFALPMLVEVPGKTLYSVFGSIFKINDIYSTLGSSGLMYLISTILMIMFAIVALANIALAIVSLVGVCKKKYSHSMALAIRCLSLFNSVLASVATILLVLYISQNNLTATTFGVGTIIPLAMSLIVVAGSFTLPSANEFFITRNKEERLAKEKIEVKEN